MLSDSSSKKASSPKRRKTKETTNLPYSDNQKLELIKMYLLTGNLTASAAALGINLDTCKKWKQTDWWSETIADLKTESKIQLSSKLGDIASKALAVTVDRLEFGDFFYDQRTSELVRKPVSMREANKVAIDAVNLQLDMQADEMEEITQKAVVDRLEALKRAFEDFSKVKDKKQDAIHDQRQEGLQEGSELGEDTETQESKRSGDEDESSTGDGESRESL